MVDGSCANAHSSHGTCIIKFGRETTSWTSYGFTTQIYNMWVFRPPNGVLDLTSSDTKRCILDICWQGAVCTVCSHANLDYCSPAITAHRLALSMEINSNFFFKICKLLAANTLQSIELNLKYAASLSKLSLHFPDYPCWSGSRPLVHTIIVQ